MITADKPPPSSTSKAQPRRQEWNYRPALPIEVSPVFQWPPSLPKILKWFWNAWFPLSERLIILALAAISWFYLHPELARCREFAIGWMAQIHARNLALMLLVAGGIHMYLYVFRQQHDSLRYDARPLVKHSGLFTFGSQVRDNMFWSCVSGVTIWSLYECLMMWAISNGYASSLGWMENPVWFVALFFLIPIWETFYFYWIHRMLHWPPLYRLAHSLHHRNTNIGPWSGLSMHPIEHILYLGSVLIHWLVAAHPLHILYHLQYFTLTAATTHCGFEGLLVKNKNRLALGTYHHQMHHRYFECNYGGLEIPFDKWFDSFHDGSAQSHARFQERRKRSRKDR